MQTNGTVEDINMNTYNYCHLKVTKIQKHTLENKEHHP